MARLVRFGSVGGGGRYDDLVARFTGQRVPATGFSFGVSRLAVGACRLHRQCIVASVARAGRRAGDGSRRAGRVIKAWCRSCAAAGIRAEMYLGTSGMKAQMKYADKRGAPCVVIQGGDERAAGEVQIKDLVRGLARLSREHCGFRRSGARRPGRRRSRSPKPNLSMRRQGRARALRAGRRASEVPMSAETARKFRPLRHRPKGSWSAVFTCRGRLRSRLRRRSSSRRRFSSMWSARICAGEPTSLPIRRGPNCVCGRI